MTSRRKAGGSPSGEAEDPGWETRLFQKIEDMDRRARQLQERWAQTS